MEVSLASAADAICVENHPTPELASENRNAHKTPNAPEAPSHPQCVSFSVVYGM
jgi:hypothetical protein